MKINEVCSPLKTYLATVRVVLKNGSLTTRTTITADTASNAFAMLSRIYGLGNVSTLTQIVTETPQSDQIQREAAITPQRVQRQAQPRKIAQTQPSQVVQKKKQPRRRQLSARIVPTPIKRELVRQSLTKQFARAANTPIISKDDIRVAADRFVTSQKRVDLEYEK